MNTDKFFCSAIYCCYLGSRVVKSSLATGGEWMKEPQCLERKGIAFSQRHRELSSIQLWTTTLSHLTIKCIYCLLFHSGSQAAMLIYSSYVILNLRSCFYELPCSLITLVCQIITVKVLCRGCGRPCAWLARENTNWHSFRLSLKKWFQIIIYCSGDWSEQNHQTPHLPFLKKQGFKNFLFFWVSSRSLIFTGAFNEALFFYIDILMSLQLFLLNKFSVEKQTKAAALLQCQVCWWYQICPSFAY